MLLDTRAPESFASGHLRGSINVGLDGRFAEYAGDVVRPGQQVVLLGDAGRGTEAKVRLARIGFDAVVGEVADIETVLADPPRAGDLGPPPPGRRRRRLARRGPRSSRSSTSATRARPRSAARIPGARNLPLPQLLDHLDELDPTRPTVVYCAGGYRSSVAASTLARPRLHPRRRPHRRLRRLGIAPRRAGAAHRRRSDPRHRARPAASPRSGS